MKRIFLFAATLLLSISLIAGEKVIQSSAKRAPKWLGAMETSYFIASAEGTTLEDAQEKAMTRIREQIVYAVATNVKAATDITIHSVNENGEIDERIEMTGQTSVRAADIPYLASISPSRAEDYFWQKIRREDKSIYFQYYIKYPFPNSRLRTLVSEYEARQQAINDTIQAFASADLASYDDLNQILQLPSRVKAFAETLPEEDGRRDICKTIRHNYERTLAQNLHVEVLSSNRQEVMVALFYGPKHLSFTLTPRTKSNCLSAIQTKNLGDATRITFDFQSGCYEDEENYIDIIYTVLTKKFSTRCFIH